MKKNGFSLVEILITISILGILSALVLTAVSSSREKGYDTRIRNDVSQLRYLAESVYDTQGAKYTNWTQHPSVTTALATLLEDVDKNSADAPGEPYVTTIRDSQITNYCVSAPLRAQAGMHYCIDATGVFRTAPTGCPDDDGTTPLRCPGN